MNQFNIYIGADNVSGKIDKAEIVRLLSSSFNGFTITLGCGFWQGKEEEVAIITIFTIRTRVELIYIVAELCRKLRQDCIILQSVDQVDFVTGDSQN